MDLIIDFLERRKNSKKKLRAFVSSLSIGSEPGSPPTVSSSKLMFKQSMLEKSTPKQSERKNSKKIDEQFSAIEIFHKARSVRLRSSAHDKYLIADEDEETVKIGRDGSSRKARWRVELVPGSEKLIRLKSCHGGYLTASNERFMLGATGHKVVQSIRNRSCEPEGEWEPVEEGLKVKLKTRNGGNYLRANGGLPPWRNSVTHDLPNLSATQHSLDWDVDVVEIMESPYGTR